MILSKKKLAYMAHNTDISAVTDILVNEGKLIRGNSKDSFLCPYHEEKTGSFKIFKVKNSIKCFGCPAYKTPINLYCDLYNYSDDYKVIACLEICYKTGQINDYNIYAKNLDYYLNAINRGDRPIFELESNKIHRNSTVINNNYQNFNQDNNISYHELENFNDVVKSVLSSYNPNSLPPIDTLNTIYCLFRYATENVRGYRLTYRHLKHLKEDRKLSEQEIYDIGFFSLGSVEHEEAIMNKLISLLNEYKISLDYLAITPGFIYEQSLNRFTYFNMGKIQPLVIPINDPFQNIQRLQLRLTSYLWFATKHANNCKSPSTTELPSWGIELFSGRKFSNDTLNMIKTLNNDGGITIGVTEGKFKALAIVKYLNIPCIAIQGLGSWKSAAIAISKIQLHLQQLGLNIKEVLIIFDSDTKVKHGLMDNGKKLSRVLRGERIPCNYISWKSNLGKGYDDIALAGHSNKIIKTPDLEYERKHDLILELLSYMFMVRVKDLKKPHLEPGYENIEELSIQELTELCERYKLIYAIARKSLQKEPTTDEIYQFCQFYKDKSLEELSYQYNYNS